MSLRIYFGLISIILGTIPYGGCQLLDGGPIISLEEFGFQAAIHIIAQGSIIRVCGGTILSQNHILATASCFSKIPKKIYNIIVRVGTINLLNFGDVYNVSKVERHPEYNSIVSTHNLAIVSINSGIVFVPRTSYPKERYIKAVNDVKLSREFVFGGDQVRVSGFDARGENVLESRGILRDLSSFTMNYFACLDYFRDSPVSVELIDDEILCMRNNPAAGYCDILDGSPLIMEGKLIGLYLYRGGNCDDERVPILFTRISNNLLWIESIVHPSRFQNTNKTCVAY